MGKKKASFFPLDKLHTSVPYPSIAQTLVEQLADVPTPAGPTPRELAASRKAEQKVIPLKSVQRAQKQEQDKT